MTFTPGIFVGAGQVIKDSVTVTVGPNSDTVVVLVIGGIVIRLVRTLVVPGRVVVMREVIVDGGRVTSEIDTDISVMVDGGIVIVVREPNMEVVIVDAGRIVVAVKSIVETCLVNYELGLEGLEAYILCQ